MIKTKKQMYTVIGAFVLVMLLGTITYAFFNYTRTGTANNIRTGRIYFNTSQNGTLNLTNLFPVASSEVGSSNDQITVRIQGDTTYTGGEEFEISLVSVNNSITSGSTEKAIPINYIASYERTPVATGETPNNIGTSSNDYFTERGSTTAVYELNAAGEVSEGKQVLVGYIPKDVAIDGTLTIKAYLDGSNIAISDTYPSGDVTHTETSGETSVEVVDYTDGTTSEWVNGRTVLTTDEWNSLQNTPISFKVRAESNEGIWAKKQVPIISTCPDCKYMYTVNNYCIADDCTNKFVRGNHVNMMKGTIAEIDEKGDVLYDDYRDIINSGNNIFLGVRIEDDTIVNAHICTIKGENPNEGLPFCIEATSNADQLLANSNYLKTIYDTCSDYFQSYVGNVTKCSGIEISFVNRSISVNLPQEYISNNNQYCAVQDDVIYCVNNKWTGA